MEWRDGGTYAAVMREEDGVTLDVSVDDALSVEDRQGLQDRQTHGGDLLLVHPAARRAEHTGASGVLDHRRFEGMRVTVALCCPRLGT